MELVEKLIEAIEEQRLLMAEKDRVYLVTDAVLGKKYEDEVNARNEYEMGKFLLERGFSVPEMHELISPATLASRLSCRRISEWFVLMQRIASKPLFDLEEGELREALRRYRRELRGILELGIYPNDQILNPTNQVFGNDGKIYFTDLELWRKGTLEEIKDLHNWLIHLPAI